MSPIYKIVNQDDTPLYQISKPNPNAEFWTMFYFKYAGHQIPPKRIEVSPSSRPYEEICPYSADFVSLEKSQRTHLKREEERGLPSPEGRMTKRRSGKRLERAMRTVWNG